MQSENSLEQKHNQIEGELKRQIEELVIMKEEANKTMNLLSNENQIINEKLKESENTVSRLAEQVGDLTKKVSYLILWYSW